MAHTAGAGQSPARGGGDSAGESVVGTASRPWAAILFSFVQSLPEELATALERHRRTFLLLFSLAYLASIGIVASRRPLWADEVLTAYMTRLGWRQLWPALASGVDLEPPCST